jgi:hypothetical protein
MGTTLEDGDIIWISRLSLIQVGDVVTLKSPMSFNEKGSGSCVKRLVAEERTFVRPSNVKKGGTRKALEFVPKNHVWVEGDSYGEDSNIWGSFPRDLIRGTVTHVLYPFSKFGNVVENSKKRRTNGGIKKSYGYKQDAEYEQKE